MVDEVTITVKAGKGGNGSSSFKRNAQTAKGGPDGGNGGKGGDVYAIGVNDASALQTFTYIKEVAAEAGVNGGKQKLFGRNGKDKLIEMPIGTVVLDLSNNTSFEILDTESKILVAKGGRGGRGNTEFKTSTNQAPRFSEKGEPGEVKQLRLELKLIADIGLIGLPNAGKSSLLEVLTNAHPKIGDYPFTTLEPNLGVMNGKIIADIPGLIEGAAMGKGLGDKFLKHIERTKIILHCIDCQSENIMKDYQVVRKELEAFSSELLNKEEIILITKTDMVEEKQIKKITKLFKELKRKIYLVSIYDDKSINVLKDVLNKYLSK